MANLFVDAALFLGMHSADEALRIRSKNFFVKHLDCGKSLSMPLSTSTSMSTSMSMSLEQVGLCDDVIWRHARAVQDAYYPFMDCLHTRLQMQRLPVSAADVECALHERTLRGFAMPERLMLAKVMLARGQLYTLRGLLLAAAPALPIFLPPDGVEQAFPPQLEAQYQTSLCLRLHHEELKL